MIALPERFSAKQKLILRHASCERYKTFAAQGGTRSGKSFATALAFALYVLTRGGGFEHVIVGRTIDQAMRNVGNSFIGFLNLLGASVSWSYGRGYIDVPTKQGNARVWVHGGAGRDAAGAVQGATYKGALLDELTLIDEMAYDMIWMRLSAPGAKLWCTTNPEHPGSWVLQKVLNRLKQYRGRTEVFLFDDNPGLSDEAKADIESGLSGFAHARYVQGLWVAAAGMVYPTWHRTSDMPKDPYWIVGYDEGQASQSAGVLFACEPASGRWADRMVAVDDFVHDAKVDRTLSDQQMERKLTQWLAGHDIEPGEAKLFVDPATSPSLKKLLREAGWRLGAVNNRVLPGISATRARLEAKNVQLLEGTCARLAGALAGYSWDPSAAQRQEDRPLHDDTSHLADALRYAAYRRPSRLAARIAYEKRQSSGS